VLETLKYCVLYMKLFTCKLKVVFALYVSANVLIEVS
jgi:hypothetical protein